MTNTEIFHVPYRGSVAAMTDLLGGQIGSMFENAPNTLPHIQSGKLRALAVGSPHRLSAAPTVPTVAESMAPGYEVETWYAVFMPAGTPAPIVSKLNASIRDILQRPEERESFLPPAPSTYPLKVPKHWEPW